MDGHSIQELAHTLRIPAFKSYQQFTEPGMTIEEALTALMSRECERRHDSLVKRRICDAGLPNGKTIDNFKIAPSIPHLKEEQVKSLATCRFIEKKLNVCALGGSGTGKTHLMAAISLEAIQLGYTVKFIRVSDMLTSLFEAGTEKRLGAMMKTLMKVDLLSLDELGYISLSAKKAQFLFDVIAKRCEAGSSIFVTSNFEFSRWRDFINVPILTKALVGKLTGDSIILNMNGEDYRLASRLK